MLFVYAGGALAISFFCSLFEATLLSVRVTELIRRAEGGGRGVNLLLMYKQERIEDGIGAILTLNTIAHTIGASLAGAQAARAFASDTLTEEAAVAGFSAILTVAVLVATEIIPKTLGTNYASALASFVGYSVHALAIVTKPILVVTGFLTRLMSRGEPEGISRGELQALVNMAQSHGAIEHDESRVLTNLLGFEGLAVEDVMTPRTVVRMIALDSTIGDLVDDQALSEHTRIPVFEGNRDNVKGYVHQLQLLRAVARGGSRDAPLGDFIRPVVTLAADTTLGEALRQFLDTRDHLAIVQDAFGRHLRARHPRRRRRDPPRRGDCRRGGPRGRSARPRRRDPRPARGPADRREGGDRSRSRRVGGRPVRFRRGRLRLRLARTPRRRLRRLAPHAEGLQHPGVDSSPSGTARPPVNGRSGEGCHRNAIERGTHLSGRPAHVSGSRT